MPVVVPTRRLLVLAALVAGGWAATPARAAVEPEATVRVEPNSGLDAPMFYQLLIGEMELRAGNAGAAYEILLDGARKTRDERLFRRATEIALQGRAGEQALAAAQAWRTALPESAEAHRFTAQLLVGLNRTAEALEPLRTLIAATPYSERAAAIASIPRFFARAADRKTLAGVVEQALLSYAGQPDTRVAALVTSGRMRLLAQEPERALALARQAQQADPAAEGPALLALELVPAQPEAESLVRAYLQANPRGNALRLAYVRTLVASQRYGEAAGQLETATRIDPEAAQPWLSLGALRVELKQPASAQTALARYIDLVQARGSAAASGGEESAANAEGLTQAYLLMAQAAEDQRDFAQAEQWLARIDNADGALSVQLRRASLLAKQGRLDEGRALLRRVPEKEPQDGRAKLLAESSLLRDVKQWGEAYRVLEQASERFPDDADLLYEQAMMAEKINRIDEMERLLRRVIELKPDHYHAYNALGYTLADRGQRLEEARELVRKALSFAPNEPFIIDSLGWIEYRLGQRESALGHLQRAYQARPDAEIGAHLGEVLWVLGRRDEARKVWREARERDATNEVLRETLTRLKVDL